MVIASSLKNSSYKQVSFLFKFLTLFVTKFKPSIYNDSIITVAAAAKLLQSCLTLRPHRRQSPGFPVPGILQARTLEWVAISSSNQLWLQFTKWLHEENNLRKITQYFVNKFLKRNFSSMTLAWWFYLSLFYELYPLNTFSLH